MLTSLKKDLEERMIKVCDSLKEDLKGLRTGRATTHLLEPVMVEAYGGMVPLSQVGTVSVKDSRLLEIQVWDSGLIGAVEKAIQKSGLGLNPMVAGVLIRVPLPELTQERRQEFVKMAHKYAENAKVSIRGVRRDGMDIIKKHVKNKEISDDEEKRLSDDVQKSTDAFIGEIDSITQKKEKDILTI